jgi:replication-associated recombination protein RarA
MLDIAKYDPETPKTLNDIIGNTDVWRELAEQIRTNSCPHIVLSGPAGCGKSLFIRILLEYEKRQPLLMLDCTANSGLRDLRDNIRGFARGSRTQMGDFRWIVLEHADALAADTQAFLRRMMETTSNTTRFLFECSDAGAIAEPILSRSRLYNVNAPLPTEIRYEINRRTGFKLSAETCDAIEQLSGGNMRLALLNALACHWNGEAMGLEQDCREYRDILAARPTTETAGEREWIAWAIYADNECRLRGLDCRDLLTHGWSKHPDISYMRLQWSRLGGISTRAMFFRSVQKLSGCSVGA